jgi:Zn-dependent peptidase ImmA (M78 family)
LYDPWADLRARPHICCDWHSVELPKGHGWWLPDVLGIVLDRRLTSVQRRCTLAHELRHADHHDEQIALLGPDGPRLARRQEIRANREAAQLLVELPDLAAALRAHPDDPAAVADELHVTPDVLHCRLDTMSAADRERLVELLENLEQAA